MAYGSWISSLTSSVFIKEHPNLVKDQFWDEQYPELPYTAATEENRNNAHPELGSTALIEVSDFDNDIDWIGGNWDLDNKSKVT